MSLFFHGQSILGERGPAGPDGNPIGTIISYMGKTAPKDYLICDGSIYNIADLPQLAAFFKEQFDSEDYFGGSVEEGTFAIPDMRNLFIRGHHGEGEERLSGEIGKKQDGTKHVSFISGIDRSWNPRIWFQTRDILDDVVTAENTDTHETGDSYRLVTSIANSNTPTSDYEMTYTSRPVNMAVLYCIKATKEDAYEDVYSLEETVIGKWIDERPLYRKVIETTAPPGLTSGSIVYPEIPYCIICDLRATMYNKNVNTWIPLPVCGKSGTYLTLAYEYGAGFDMQLNVASYASFPVTIVVEYVKTTDGPQALNKAIRS